jgi:hypothetical protein
MRAESYTFTHRLERFWLINISPTAALRLREDLFERHVSLGRREGDDGPDDHVDANLVIEMTRDFGGASITTKEGRSLAW